MTQQETEQMLRRAAVAARDRLRQLAAEGNSCAMNDRLVASELDETITAAGAR